MNRHSSSLLLHLESQTVERKLVQVTDIHTHLTVDSLCGLVDRTMRESDVIQPRVVVDYSEDLLPYSH